MQAETYTSGTSGIAGTLSELRPVAPDAERFRAMVRSAILAPSSHNSQPWIFHIPLNCAFVELYADRSRALPVVDPDDRELLISCGSALFGLRLAARHMGFDDIVEILPDASDPDLLARLRLGEPRRPSVTDEQLFAALPRRHTNRRQFEQREVPDALLLELAQAAEAEGAALTIFRAPADRERAADLIAEADRRQWASRTFRRELAAWVHPNRTRSRDGMPGYALRMGDIASIAGPIVVRTFDQGEGQAARDRELAVGSPAMVLLWTAEDTPRAWLSAGQALQRVLLRATAAGVSASYLNQPIEVGELRTVLGTAFRVPGAPQMLLRLGYGPEVQATPRRELEEVLR